MEEENAEGGDRNIKTPKMKKIWYGPEIDEFVMVEEVSE